MRRLLSVLSLVSVAYLVVSVGLALAQTVTTDEPVPQKMWEVILKTAIPLVMVVAGPYATGWITSSFAKVPPPVQYLITTILGVVTGALAGQIPDFPLATESAANIGGASGAAGQFLANRKRATLHPKTDVVLAKMSPEEKAEVGHA